MPLFIGFGLLALGAYIIPKLFAPAHPALPASSPWQGGGPSLVQRVLATLALGAGSYDHAIVAAYQQSKGLAASGVYDILTQNALVMDGYAAPEPFHKPEDQTGKDIVKVLTTLGPEAIKFAEGLLAKEREPSPYDGLPERNANG